MAPRARVRRRVPSVVQTDLGAHLERVRPVGLAHAEVVVVELGVERQLGVKAIADGKVAHRSHRAQLGLAPVHCRRSNDDFVVRMEGEAAGEDERTIAGGGGGAQLAPHWALHRVAVHRHLAPWQRHAIWQAPES